MDKNKAVIKGDFVEISVTSKSLGTHIVRMDLTDYKTILNGRNIHIIKGARGRALYAVMNVYYNGKSRPRGIHREIMGNPSCEVDHIDEDGLNNCRSNLRLADRSQNGANISKPSSNTSGYKGVHFQKSANKYSVNITVRGKTLYGGLYDTAEEAAKCYDDLAKKHFGEYAKGNNIKDDVVPKRSIVKSETTGYKGVYLIQRKTCVRYQAKVSFQNRSIHIGFYKTPEEAALAYNKAAIKYHGDKAYVNVLNQKT